MLFTVNNRTGRLVLDLDSMKANKSESKLSAKRIISLLLASATILGSLTACGADNKKGPYFSVSSMDTITGTLEDISPVSTVDEFLAEKKFESSKTGEEFSFEELNAYYIESRKNEDLSSCNDALYKIGRMLLMSLVAESFDIEAKDVVGFSFYSRDTGSSEDRTATIKYKYRWTETVSGGVTLEHEEVRTKEVLLKGEYANAAINLGRACNHSLEFASDSWMDLDVDNVYCSLIELLLTSTKLTTEEEGLFRKQIKYILEGNYDADKVAAFRK